jgi:hypothetical protein
MSTYIPMAPKNSSLTEAESLLFPISARLLTAFRYKEAHPDGDFSHFVGKIEEEMVSHTYLSLLKKLMQSQQNLMTSICTKYPPTPPATLHMVHPIISVIIREWNRAAEERCPPNLDKITGKDIDIYCARLASTHPELPAILCSTDLSKHAMEQAPKKRWWLPHPGSEGGGGV